MTKSCRTPPSACCTSSHMASIVRCSTSSSGACSVTCLQARTAFSSQAHMPVLNVVQCNDCTRLKLLYNRGTVSYPLNPSATNREKQDNPDAYRMLSSLLYGSDARRIKQRIVLRTGRKKQCGCSSNAYGDCPNFNCPHIPSKEKKLPC